MDPIAAVVGGADDAQVEVELHAMRHAREGDGTLGSQLKLLKRHSKCSLVALGLVLLVFLIWHWQFFMCALLLLLPSVRLVHWWLKNQSLVPLDHVVSSYAQGFFFVLALGTGTGFLAWLIATALLFSIFSGLFGMGSFMEWIAFMEIMRWSVFVGVEELWKLLFLRYSKLRRQHRVGGNTRAHAVSGAAMSLGYATSQSMLFMIFVTLFFQAPSSGGGESITNGEFGWMTMLTLFFGMVSMPLNIMSTYLEGVELSKVDGDTGGCCCPCGFPPGGCAGVSAFLYILRWPVAIRAVFVAQFFIWVVLLGAQTGQWLLTLVMIILSIAAIYCAAYRLIKRLDADADNSHDIYRSVYGFSLLSDDDAMPVPGRGGAQTALAQNVTPVRVGPGYATPIGQVTVGGGSGGGEVVTSPFYAPQQPRFSGVMVPSEPVAAVAVRSDDPDVGKGGMEMETETELV